MFVEDKKQKGLTRNKRVLILLTLLPYGGGLSSLYFGAQTQDTRLLILGWILLVGSAFFSAYVGFTQRVLFSVPQGFSYGKHAVFLAWFHLLIGIFLLLAPLIGIYIGFNKTYP